MRLLLALSAVLILDINLPAIAAETVSFPSSDKTLHGLLYKPAGEGPFPVVLYNHGSAPGLTNNQAFDLIAPYFTVRGWVFFAPYRRGQGLSGDAGPYIMDEIKAARDRGGERVAAETMVRLLSTTQFQDQIDALAWLKAQPFAQPSRIAVMGNSFGGIETVLSAARPGYCAAVDASGGAESWDNAPTLRTLLLGAVRASKTPIFFFQAENDFNLTPSHALYEAVKAKHGLAEIRIYPRYGSTPQEGHSFAWRGVDIWSPDVTRFIETHCAR